MGLFKRDRKGAGKARSDETFQLVSGGNVRRIEFEDEYDVHLEDEVEAPEATEHFETLQIERHYRPRHVAPLDDIRFEIDHLEQLKAGHVPRDTPIDRTDLRSPSRTVYTTDRGGKVVEATTPGGRKALYTRGSNILSERRFHEKLVDDVVKDIDLSEAITIEEEVVEYVPKTVAEGIEKPKVKGKTIKTSPKAKATKVSKAKAVDTKPAVQGAEDTEPGKAGQKVLQAQCSALTAAGKQCRNSSRTTSKYCGAHKGYRAKSS